MLFGPEKNDEPNDEIDPHEPPRRNKHKAEDWLAALAIILLAAALVDRCCSFA